MLTWEPMFDVFSRDAHITKLAVVYTGNGTKKWTNCSIFSVQIVIIIVFEKQCLLSYTVSLKL